MVKIKKVIIHTVDILMFVQDSTGSVSDKETMVWKRPDFILQKICLGHDVKNATLSTLHY